MHRLLRSAAEIVKVTTAFCLRLVLPLPALLVASSRAAATRELPVNRTCSSDGSVESRARTRATDSCEYVAPWIVTPGSPG